MTVRGAVVPDVSSWNKALTANFEREFLIFRVADGNNFLDPKFLTNTSVLHDLYANGKVAGAIGYQVYRPVSPASMYDFYWKAIGPSIPDWLKGAMTDVESWGGAITGDQSTPVNNLVGRHAHQFGSWSSAIGYGNQNDLSRLWPNRDKRIKVIVASYGSQIVVKNVPGAIGQQYTDGSGRWPVPAGLPMASKEFGRVDHNVFPGFADGAALANYLRPPATPEPPPAKKPKPKPRHLYRKGVSHLTSGNRKYQVVLGPQGHLRLYLEGDQVGEFQLIRTQNTK